MAQNLRDVANRHTLSEQDRRAAVPQEVKRKHRQVLSVAVRTPAIDDPRVLAFLPSSDPRLSQQSLQITGHAAAVERASLARRKDEAGTFGAPFSPSQKLTLPLSLPMLD